MTKGLHVTATITDDTEAGLIVDAEFIREFGGQFINGEYFPDPKKEEILND
jgi:hypothetical protein